ncbi:MAG: HNH endonuclease signature motif containing protein [Candidatus Gracilibacteria bacterium]|jgi:hypothetical protein
MKNIHEKFVHYGKNAKYWLRQCALLLPEIAEKEIWKQKGFGSIYEYAGKLAGMSKAQVDTALWVVRAVEDKPELKKVVEEKGINCVRPVVAIATTETANFWAEKAKGMSKGELETYVRDYKMDFIPGNKIERIEIELDPKVADQLKKMKGDRDWNTFMKELMDGQAKPESAQTKQIPDKIRKYVIAKTNGTCAYPGCTKHAEELHHTQRRALDHEHNPDDIIPLCKDHHQLAHHGLIDNEEKQPYEWGILKNPDTTNPKYEIDKMVQKYRSG